MYYITLHCSTLHSTTLLQRGLEAGVDVLHYTTLHYTTLQRGLEAGVDVLHYTTLHCSTLHYYSVVLRPV